MTVSRRDRFFELLRSAVRDGTLAKLTLGKYRGSDETVRNVFIQPVTLKAGPHLAFVWRHATRDVTKNLPLAPGLETIDRLIGTDFLDAHLFTPTHAAQLETKPDGEVRVRIKETQNRPATGSAGTGVDDAVVAAGPGLKSHDAAKQYLIPAHAPWLRALGVTSDRGQPREGMTDKYRQIQKFAEVLSHLMAEAFPPGAPRPGRGPLEIADMGSGKGYLTFAVAALLGDQAKVRGIEARPALVELGNGVARSSGLSDRLSFITGTIAATKLDPLDVLIALHACDTATDDALARGIAAGARLLVVSPCCQKELRPQLQAPRVLADALRHGIFQERQAEFVTDALRAQLLEWAGYRTKVFEFISTEHTAKNVMIAAIRRTKVDEQPAVLADRIRAFAEFYGIRQQRLAQHLGVSLQSPREFVPQTSE